MTGLILNVTTPLNSLVSCQEVSSVRAEDASGSFGILAGHVDFLTVLPASVLRWRLADGSRRFCAMRSGLLRVSGGAVVDVACREGVLGDDLEQLLAHVRDLRQAEQDEERKARVEAMRMQTQTVRRMMQVFHPHNSQGLTHPSAIGSGAANDTA